MKIFSPLTLVTLAASFRGIGAASSCLQPGADNYKCDSGGTTLELGQCGIDDSDVNNGSLQSCLSTFGRANMKGLRLGRNSLTTLPRNIFNGLEAMITLDLTYNELTSLPTRIFDKIRTVENLFLSNNQLETLPNRVFDKLGSLHRLSLTNNELTTLRDGVFDALVSMTMLNLDGNKLTRVADDLFDENVSLKHLDIRDNDWDCRPTLPSTISTRLVDPGHICSRCPDSYDGILNLDDAGDTCCAESCGACKERRCHKRPGGRSNCCPSTIRAEASICNWETSAPCNLQEL